MFVMFYIPSDAQMLMTRLNVPFFSSTKVIIPFEPTILFK